MSFIEKSFSTVSIIRGSTVYSSLYNIELEVSVATSQLRKPTDYWKMYQSAKIELKLFAHQFRGMYTPKQPNPN